MTLDRNYFSGSGCSGSRIAFRLGSYLELMYFSRLLIISVIDVSFLFLLKFQFFLIFALSSLNLMTTTLYIRIRYDLTYAICPT